MTQTASRPHSDRSHTDLTLTPWALNTATDCTFSHYKFHAAFESNSQDGHMTEKLWGGLVNGGSVPLYWGAPDVARYLPHPDAVVSVHAFSSMRELAGYLEACMANRTMFERHLAWKRMDPAEWNPEFLKQVHAAKPGLFCQVCDRAVREKNARRRIGAKAEL